MRASLAQRLKHLPAMRETWVQSVGWEDPLEKELATHSSTLAWRIPLMGGARWATVHRASESLTGLSDFTFLVAQSVKNLPAMRETWVQSLGCEDPLEEGMATHSSLLDWRIPMDGGAWRATVHGVANSPTRPSD